MDGHCYHQVAPLRCGWSCQDLGSGVHPEDLHSLSGRSCFTSTGEQAELLIHLGRCEWDGPAFICIEQPSFPFHSFPRVREEVFVASFSRTMEHILKDATPSIRLLAQTNQAITYQSDTPTTTYASEKPFFKTAQWYVTRHNSK